MFEGEQKADVSKFDDVRNIEYTQLQDERYAIVPLKSYKPTLREIFSTHEGKISDKWLYYLEIYDTLFIPYRDRKIVIIEVGVQNGGSLEVLAKYFTNAVQIIGIDVNQNCENLIFDDPRIKVIIGDAGDRDIADRIKELAKNDISIIIDDGSHTNKDIIRTFANLFPLLEDGGLYIIEDLHTSYWKEFGGGLFNPESAINFLKRLIDIVNYESWNMRKTRTELLKHYTESFNVYFDEDVLAHIHSIAFYNSLAVIRKDKPNKNKLGIRMISGKEEVITTGIKKLDGMFLLDFISIFTPDEVHKDPIELIKELNRVYSSMSWKITKPLRWLRRKLKI